MKVTPGMTLPCQKFRATQRLDYPRVALLSSWLAHREIRRKQRVCCERTLILGKNFKHTPIIVACICVVMCRTLSFLGTKQFARVEPVPAEAIADTEDLTV